MRSNTFKRNLVKPAFAASVLFLASGAAHAQQQINLTAGPAMATLPDGQVVPMWGYSCGSAVGGSTAPCAPLSAAAATGGWSPVAITIPAGQTLQINLTNNLSFPTSTAVPP